MYCANCGKKLEEDSRFCDNCGVKVEEDGPIVEMAKEPARLPEGLSAGDEAMGHEGAAKEGSDAEKVEAPGGDGFAGQMPEGLAGPQSETPAGEAGGVYRKPSSWNKLAWVELAALLALGFGFYRYVGTMNDPATTARQYCDAMVGKDVARAYGCLAIPEGGFLTEEAFYRAVDAGGYGDVVNYKVQPLGGAQKDEDTIARDYEVRYIQSGGQREFTEKIRLVKGKDKKYFLFDEWKVSPGSLLAEDIGIIAPKPAEVSVDGISLEPAETRDGMRRYRIDAMFQGDYTVSVSAPGFTPYSVTMDVGHDGEVLELGMGYLSEEAVAQLTGQAAEDLQGLMASLLNNQPSQIVAGSASPMAAQMERSYEETRGGMGLDSYQYTKSTISDITGTGFASSAQEDGLLLSLDLHYHWSYEYIRSKQSFLGNAPMQREKDVVSSFTYQYQDGAWQLYDFSI